MTFVGIIPARYASSRFPGKPLADLCGMPVIQHVYQQAAQVLDIVYVATDDTRIYDCVQSFGGQVVMTSDRHTCGTDRVYEAYQTLRSAQIITSDPSDTVVINIQGDEPFIQPQQIHALMQCFPTDIATLVHPFTTSNTLDELRSPNLVKVAIAHATDPQAQHLGRALYFSRSVIPHLRGVDPQHWLQHACFYRHIGMYAYRADVLARITQLPVSALEQLECLEQLRWLEHGLTIQVALTHHASIGIDTPEDLQMAIQYIQQ
jgi:3-deoxy-manno-octulosonate cytidylyltransferase (CMP-KDO synthetase)